VTVERVVDELQLRPGGIVIPGWVIGYVAEAPHGWQPSYALGFTERDNDFYREWDRISRDRDLFTDWMKEHVMNTRNDNVGTEVGA
jgi:glutaconate CoA-transferase subunit A